MNKVIFAVTFKLPATPMLVPQRSSCVKLGLYVRQRKHNSLSVFV